MRYDWYQTDGAVVVSFLTKNCSKEEALIDITDDTVTVERTGPQPDKGFVLLQKSIDASAATHKILSSKIEVKLPKKEATRWSNLERTESATEPVKVAPKNWDIILKETETEDKPQGDEAVNDLFRKIYGDADENTRRAMKKSFMESGGTVLSTDWAKVGAGKVEVSPPDGLEYKKFET